MMKPDEIYELPVAAERPQAKTLDQLLVMLSNADDELGEPFDPEQVVGDIRLKVDDIRYVIKLLEGRAAIIKADAVALADKAHAISRNAERLEEYTIRSMVTNSFEKLPGVRWVLRRQRNNPSLKYLRHEPNELDRQLFPELVEEIPARLVWRNDRVKAGLKDGLLAGLCDFAELTVGYQIRWDVNTPEPDRAALEAPPAKKPRKKKEAT